MPVITSIDDLRHLHRRRTPKMFFDYCESGSWTEQTFRENSSDFDKIRFRQRVAVDMSGRTLKGTMLGQPVTMPVALAPIGSLGMQNADGEIKAARAAARFGVPYTLSTMSICSIEDVAQNSADPFWFQLYVMQDTGFVDEIIERARAANCSALVLTLDLQILGQRHKDIKNGLSAPPKITPRNAFDFATKWRWSFGMAGTKRRTFRNIVGHASSVGDLTSLSAWTAEQFDPRLDWAKVERIRERWGGKLILKGILDAEDAKLAVKAGADAIVVSNHGGRQLDGALSSIRMLPSVVRAVKGETEIWLDSGIRSGQDILKAIALGADATMVGRAYVYGLGAMGEAGVTRALEILQKEMDVTMALCGRRTLREVARDILLVPRDFEGDWAENA
ncbi:alpha-hydroxy-acid oxidizing protein [Rubellimicrobium rubrum]|uniref:Alpha-hydroxy-acid oxidizing protein n=1 Tax=Rubellimicrobium rubrum TaxID=2585369 RepID=A0A5C4MX17_9RHOB|nr:alpha-hydroxy acid oxidase [Rubellimicrobium rubrum]TNC48942.1 alpha-hydroxy-acid oxidizing protein [Rubellimicrobium rubrum]